MAQNSRDVYYTFTVRGVTVDSRDVRKKPFDSLDDFRQHTASNRPGELQGVVFREYKAQGETADLTC